MTEFETAQEAFARWAESDPDRPFMHQPVNGEVQTWTRAATLDGARRLATALRGLGLEPGEKVAILSKNCAEWVISDLAISMAGLISVPIFPTAGGETIAYVLADSDARAIIIGRLDDPGAAEAVGDSIATISMQYPAIECQHDWNELIEGAEPIEDWHAPAAEDVMTILYTSGSTGRPKGVVISYGAYVYASNTTLGTVGMTANDRLLSYLPLAHITERTVVAGPALYTGATLYFTESLETFPADLQRAQVTLFLSVPRLWTRFQSGIHQQIPPKRLSLLLKIPVVRGLIARKIRRALGLDNSRLFGSGTAPISIGTLHWYERLGIKIREGWGMSETCGLSCTNTPFRKSRLGTIGAPIPGTEMKISDEGEILVRSPGLFSEYHNLPELTAEAFTEDGFFRTGDRAQWDETLEAFTITGRVKDIFKSAKGKYVAPVPIESKLAANPLVEQVCVMGAGLRAPVAVVVLSAAAEPSSRDEIETSLRSTLKEVNAGLESHERMSHVFIAQEEWSIENGLLTPTLKFKRDLIEDRYAERIAELGADSLVWAAASGQG